MIKIWSGLGMPWFEKLGLRALFGLKMLKAETSTYGHAAQS